MAPETRPQVINRIDVTGRVGPVRGTGSAFGNNGQIILNDLTLEELESLRQIMYAATGSTYYLGREPFEIVRDFTEYAADQYQIFKGQIELVVGDTGVYDLPEDYEDEDV